MHAHFSMMLAPESVLAPEYVLVEWRHKRWHVWYPGWYVRLDALQSWLDLLYFFGAMGEGGSGLLGVRGGGGWGVIQDAMEAKNPNYEFGITI